MRNLSREQVVELEQAYKKARKVRERERYHALRLLSKGYTRKDVQEILGISRQALGDWVTKYHKQGLAGLKEKPQPGNTTNSR